MNSLFSPILSYMPHGNCYLWQTPLVSLHVISDCLIALAYFSIPITLLYFVFSRQDVPFMSIFVLFGAFIILCGIGHLLEIWTLWHANYWISGIEQAITAIVSCYTAASMVILIPQFLSLKTPEELALINQQLQVEVQMRQQSEKQLSLAKDNLEQRVQERTAELEMINQTLESEIKVRQAIETALRESENNERQKAERLHETLQNLQSTQGQLVQAEKMAALGKMVGGIAHEINNPITFIYSNIEHLREYSRELLELVGLYRQFYPQSVEGISAHIELIDLNFIEEDFPQLLDSMQAGAERIKQIILSLRSFSHLDETGLKSIDLNTEIKTMLDLISNRLSERVDRRPIEVLSNLDKLPKIECYPGELNQGLLNLFENAIDALQERTAVDSEFSPQIAIATKIIPENQEEKGRVEIIIQDNGVGIPDRVIDKIFDPFFSTKPVGKGTGLGLTNTYQVIVQQHRGKLECTSIPGRETKFKIELPLCQTHLKDSPFSFPSSMAEETMV